jgi:hypothetical protein
MTVNLTTINVKSTMEGRMGAKKFEKRNLIAQIDNLEKRRDVLLRQGCSREVDSVYRKLIQKMKRKLEAIDVGEL